MRWLFSMLVAIYMAHQLRRNQQWLQTPTNASWLDDDTFYGDN